MEEQTIQSDPFATGVMTPGLSAGAKAGGGRYCLTRILGRGGMGIVWLAQDDRLGTEVALKFLPPQIRYDAAALDDLRRETARSRKLSHPNIIRIHDLFEAPEEDAFISMEYIDGRNLADLRVEQASRVFSWTFLKPLVDQLCAGLEYAHSERIIHRDLKPANLMLDKKGRLKLADFGIARAVSDTMSRNSLSHTSGTILYMSPQQMEGEAPRATDDIYALGTTLYELLTGKPPFYTGNIMHQVRNILPRPMQERLTELEFTNEIPREVEEVIMACLVKDSAIRPQSAAEVARLLNGQKLKLLETQHRLEIRGPVTSPATKPLEPKATETRRWKWLAGTALACGLGLWFFTRSNQGMGKVFGTIPTPSSIKAAEEVPAKTVVAAVPLPVVASFSKTTSTSVVALPSALVTPTPQVVKTTSSVSPESFQPSVRTEPTVAAKVPLESPVTVHKTVAPVVAPTISASNSSPAITLSKATALQLLEKGNSYVSARSKNRVLEIIGERTPVEEPPQSWRILYYDDKTTFNTVEVQFKAGEMERVREPNRLFNVFSRGSSKTLDLAKVKVDSDGAVRIAVAECADEAVTPKFVELKLERGYGGLPVWNVKLFGLIAGHTAEDDGIGSVVVLAEDGKVLKKDITTKSDKVALKK